MVAILRTERDKLKKAALEKMRQRWAANAKTETKSPPKKTARTVS
jgi:hypothetical protein